MVKKNPYDEQHDTHERQFGGNTTARGEKHDSAKALTIPANRRWDDAATTPPERQGKE